MSVDSLWIVLGLLTLVSEATRELLTPVSPTNLAAAATTAERVAGAPRNKSLPGALIIGVRKGGTRALLEFLRIHPDVRAPGPEVHFFDRFYSNGYEWYRNQMPLSLPGQLTIEKTPRYFITKEAPARIYRMSPRTRLIVVVRDPVTRAVSDYTQTASKRPGMPAFEDRVFLANSSVIDASWGAVRIGVYARHLERWLKFFSSSQILLVSGERLISDPAREMARVQRFLQLRRAVTKHDFYVDSKKGFPCLKRRRISACSNDDASTCNDVVTSAPHCLGKTKGRVHPKIDPHVIERLRDFYRPFNQQFYKMTGTYFGWS